jgi:gamma-glutamyltranspeptidase / glutathione hydrolase
MHSNETKDKFVELRAAGKSFGEISEELNVAKSTLHPWEEERADDIARLRRLHWEETEKSLGRRLEDQLQSLACDLHDYEQTLGNFNLGRLSVRETLMILRETRRAYFQTRALLVGLPSRPRSTRKASPSPSSHGDAAAACLSGRFSCPGDSAVSEGGSLRQWQSFTVNAVARRTPGKIQDVYVGTRRLFLQLRLQTAQPANLSIQFTQRDLRPGIIETLGRGDQRLEETFALSHFTQGNGRRVHQGTVYRKLSRDQAEIDFPFGARRGLLARKPMKHILILFMAAPLMTLASNRPVGKHFATRSEVIAQQGMACTSQPLATQAAIDVLKQGGSAVDAAIAANAVLGVVEPPSCGIGGDLFAIVWDAESKKLHGLNASGRSPRELKREHFVKLKLEMIPRDGPLPVSVPGCVDGWIELHRKFGKLALSQVLAPAIFYANTGYPVSEVIAEDWQKISETMHKQPGFKETYMPGGAAPGKGTIFKNPGLGRTLQKIAQAGRDGFYKGEVAETIGAFMKKHGGFLSAQDLADHKSDWIEPVSTSYRGCEVWELPPNGQGIAVLQMLNILEGYDIRGMGFGSADYAHVFIEAKKLAFEDRAKFYADPAFNKLPVKQLISKPYAERRRKLIDLKKAAKAYDAGNPAINEGDTVYLTTADAGGNMVSLIQSNYRGFGSGMVPDGLGFALQNRGEMFTLAEGQFNSYAPGKRPFHTIIPAFITREGKPWISFGVMGGAMQPQGHVQIVVNLIDFGMELQEAGDAPRIQHIGSSEPTGEVMKDGGQVYVEYGFPEETERELVKRGHKVGRTGAGSFGGYQAIRFDAPNKVYFGASESRKDGHAAGY